MFQESYMKKIVATVGVMAVVALIAYTYSTIKQAKYMYSGPTSISVVGEGEVFATPDIGTFSFTVEAKETDANTAQTKSAETMSAVLTYLKEAGVEEKDIKTEYYNLSPRYEYPESGPVCMERGGYPINTFIKEGTISSAESFPCTIWDYDRPSEPKLIGYQVSQSVSVKVRDTKKAGELVSGVGSKGAVNVSGLSFAIDDIDAHKAEAREKAITDAKEKAEVLAKNLGAKIVRMNGYWEDEGYAMPYGMGGDMMMKMESADSMSRSAEIPLGENTITSRVNISYEIK